MASIGTIEQIADRLRAASPRFLPGTLAVFKEASLHEHCDWQKINLGQYAGVHRIEPVEYFGKYGVSEQAYLAWRKYASGRGKTLSFDKFCRQHPQVAKVKVVPYVHALEILRLVYHTEWRWTDDGRLILHRYPHWPGVQRIALLDLLTGWVRFDPREWDDNVPLENVVRCHFTDEVNVPGEQKILAVGGAR